MSGRPREMRVVEGCRLPFEGAPTPNELAWIAIIREIAVGRDPKPGLAAAQALRLVITAGIGEAR